MDIIVFCKSKLLEKKSKNLTAEELEKVETIEKLLNNPKIFFYLEEETIIGILEFLEVPKEYILDAYFSLLTFNQYFQLPNYKVKDRTKK